MSDLANRVPEADRQTFTRFGRSSLPYRTDCKRPFPPSAMGRKRSPRLCPLDATAVQKRTGRRPPNPVVELTDESRPNPVNTPSSGLAGKQSVVVLSVLVCNRAAWGARKVGFDDSRRQTFGNPPVFIEHRASYRCPRASSSFHRPHPKTWLLACRGRQRQSVRRTAGSRTRPARSP